LLELVYLLKKDGFNINLLIVGSGQLENELIKITESYKITNEVVFTNQVNNIRDYMACCDLQVHLSESEASNNVVKEFALLGKPSIICKNVGDFEDYCTNENSYLIKKYFDLVDLKSIVVQIINNKKDLVRKGKKIRSTVKSIFSIDNVITKYLNVFN
jgi:glycosyltransferase involved in cell wall biosynthesis